MSLFALPAYSLPAPYAPYLCSALTPPGCGSTASAIFLSSETFCCVSDALQVRLPQEKQRAGYQAVPSDDIRAAPRCDGATPDRTAHNTGERMRRKTAITFLLLLFWANKPSQCRHSYHHPILSAESRQSGNATSHYRRVCPSVIACFAGGLKVHPASANRGMTRPSANEKLRFELPHRFCAPHQICPSDLF
jgi:hypothetical protein